MNFTSSVSSLWVPMIIEARDGLDAHAGVREARGEGFVVLLREQRRRHHDGGLFASEGRLARRAYRDLGFAEADVADDEAVHRNFYQLRGGALRHLARLRRRFFPERALEPVRRRLLPGQRRPRRNLVELHDWDEQAAFLGELQHEVFLLAVGGLHLLRAKIARDAVIVVNDPLPGHKPRAPVGGRVVLDAAARDCDAG